MAVRAGHSFNIGPYWKMQKKTFVSDSRN